MKRLLIYFTSKTIFDFDTKLLNPKTKETVSTNLSNCTRRIVFGLTLSLKLVFTSVALYVNVVQHNIESLFNPISHGITRKGDSLSHG